MGGMDKDFIGWHSLKEEIQDTRKAPLFQQREVWWCNLGVNVGDEVDGKNLRYHRPVLVFRKYNEKIFIGLPMTTTIKTNPHHCIVTLQDKTTCIMLSQMRLLDAKRLTHRKGKLTPKQFAKVRKALAANLGLTR